MGRKETRPHWSAQRTKDARVEQHLSQPAADHLETEPQYGHSREGAHKDEPSRLLTVSGGIGADELRSPQFLLNTGFREREQRLGGRGHGIRLPRERATSPATDAPNSSAKAASC